MARYKIVDLSPRFLAVDLEKQLLPGSFAHVVHHLLDHDFERRHLPLAGPATRPAQGLSAGTQLRLSASEQQTLDRAVAGGAEGDAQHRPDLDETTAAVSVRVLRGADAGGTKAYSVGTRPMACR